jgi:alcohol dehydrogenase class IV
MAGLAFTQAGLGLCHGISHALGGAFHVPHGRLNAILLPAVIGCNAEIAGSRYAQLARQAGIGGSSDTMALRNLKNGLCRLRNELKLPATLAQAGVKPSQVRQLRDEIVSAALADPCCATNPVKVDKSMVEEVLQRVTGIG